MKVYIQRTEKGSIVEINLFDLFEEILGQSIKLESETDIDIGKFGDKSGKWIEIKEKHKRKLMSLVLLFNDEGDKLIDISVFKTPIKTIIDEKNTKKLI